MDDLSQKNYLDFVKTTGKFHDLYSEANLASQQQYQLGKIHILEQAKKFLINNSEYKYVPFTEMVHKLEKFIDQDSLPDTSESKGLNLQGMNFKPRKKRGHKDDKDQQNSTDSAFPELQKTKKDA